MADFALHSMTVEGGLLALCQLPGRTGSYDDDLALIRDWKPSIVLTLCSRAELIDGGAENFGPDMRDSGARWVHLPVEDYGVPDPAFLAEWEELSTQILSVLRGQGRVLIHCKGGCGRTGMIALRLLVLAGEPAVDALFRLRKLRPCAIETDAQMRWAVTGTFIEGKG